MTAVPLIHRALLVSACCLFTCAGASETVVAAPRTEFPDQLVIEAAGSVRKLSLTGVAERVFLIFRVYDMAHYLEHDALHAAKLTPLDVLQDGPAKAIAITFSRTLGQEQIRKEFDKSLRRNARSDWLEAAGPTIGRFTDSIDRDAREGDRLVFYWLPGGRVLTEFNGERVFSADDPAFARLVWSIWFGKDPVCDVDELLARGGAPAP